MRINHISHVYSLPHITMITFSTTNGISNGLETASLSVFVVGSAVGASLPMICGMNMSYGKNLPKSPRWPANAVKYK